MRKPRYKPNGATFHVYNRINRKEHLLKLVVIKIIFLRCIRKVKLKYTFKIIHFAIMDNHFHLMIKPTGMHSDLSKIMQEIQCNFARQYNRIFKLTGHVWGDRYKSSVIKDEEHFRNVFNYISNNPVKAKLANDIFSFKFCGIYHLMHRYYHIVDEPDELTLELFPFLAA